MNTSDLQHRQQLSQVIPFRPDRLKRDLSLKTGTSQSQVQEKVLNVKPDTSKCFAVPLREWNSEYETEPARTIHRLLKEWMDTLRNKGKVDT